MGGTVMVPEAEAMPECFCAVCGKRGPGQSKVIGGPLFPVAHEDKRGRVPPQGGYTFCPGDQQEGDPVDPTFQGLKVVEVKAKG